MQLSPHFTLDEFVRSSTAAARGIANTPGPVHLANLRILAAHLEGVRALLGNPIPITSAYRSPALNQAVGGSATSDHANGLAADFTCPRFGSVIQVCEAIAASRIDFDQLIFEQKPGGIEWVHLGFGPRMRRDVLSWSPSARYVSGIKKLG